MSTESPVLTAGQTRQRAMHPKMKRITIQRATAAHDLEILTRRVVSWLRRGHWANIQLPLCDREWDYEDEARAKLEAFVAGIPVRHRTMGISMTPRGLRAVVWSL
ncbi:MAG: hypothetical protein HY369_01470 [Candidatus Aenigmarchaeota archaeon]|nr:hypothetical protein [Candidatus Aenigmarchaeota archaeon]